MRVSAANGHADHSPPRARLAQRVPVLEKALKVVAPDSAMFAARGAASRTARPAGAPPTSPQSWFD
jgi:hypothetical protein